MFTTWSTSLLCLAAAMDVQLDGLDHAGVSGMRGDLAQPASAWAMHGTDGGGTCRAGSSTRDLTFRISSGAERDNNDIAACEAACTQDLACDLFCFQQDAVRSDDTPGNNCYLWSGACGEQTARADLARGHTCYKKPASFYGNAMGGEHLPGDAANLNHLDIAIANRSACVGQQVNAQRYKGRLNADGSRGRRAPSNTRVMLTMGKPCHDAMRPLAERGSSMRNPDDNGEECARYFEMKFRGDHRVGQKAPGLTGTEHGQNAPAAENNYNADYALVAELHFCEYSLITQSCEAGSALTTCPGDAVTEVEWGGPPRITPTAR